MTLESACIPIPSEATMLFAGFNVARGEYSLIVATLVGASANLVGSWIAYGVGYFGRIELVERHGRKLHISPKHLATRRPLVRAHGEATVFFTRMMPIVRTFISLPAGVARMPSCASRSSRSSAACRGCSRSRSSASEAGANWEDWKDRLHYVDYAFARADRRGDRRTCVVAPARRRRRRPAARAPSRRRRRRERRRALPLREALALGVLHGPAELLPISSSGHVALVPWLAGWRYCELDAGAAQGVRGRAARRHRRGAADRAARARSARRRAGSTAGG